MKANCKVTRGYMLIDSVYPQDVRPLNGSDAQKMGNLRRTYGRSYDTSTGSILIVPAPPQQGRGSWDVYVKKRRV